MNNSKPKKKPRKEWTKEERELKDILSDVASYSQMRRTRGGLTWATFKQRFTNEQIAAMAIAIGGETL